MKTNNTSATAPVTFTSADFSGPGIRKLWIRHYSDGRTEVVKDTFEPDKTLPANLQEIWLPNAPFTLQAFIDTLTDNAGFVRNDGDAKIWPAGSVSVLTCYELLAGVAIPEGLNSKELYSAFAGTFKIPKISAPRSLRDQGNGKERRKKAEIWRDRFDKWLGHLLTKY